MDALMGLARQITNVIEASSVLYHLLGLHIDLMLKVDPLPLVSQLLRHIGKQ